jgi:hypothetical protein
MLFRTYEVYRDKDDIKTYTEKLELEECFICYEIITENNMKTIKLRDQNYYIKKCYCSGFIHKNCLDKWYELNLKCPICRQQIIKNESIMIKILYLNNNFVFIYLFIKNNIYYIKKLVFSLVFFYIIVNFYFNILNNINRKNYYYNDDFDNFIKTPHDINYIIPYNFSLKTIPSYHN